MVPEGWNTYKLAELADIKRGAGSQYLTYVEDSEQGLRLIRIGDFLGDNPKFVKRTKDIDRFILKKDDILIAGTGATAGITFEVPENFEGYAFSYNAPRIRPKKNIDKNFLVNFLKSDEIKRQQHSLFTGNAQPFLDTRAIGGFEISVPPLPEQKKIAEILSTWDKAIETTEKLLANAEAQKKALMQQLLTGKRRLNGFEGQEWETKSIGDMGRIVSGGTPDSENSDLWDGGIAWATPTDITKLQGRHLSATSRTISNKGLKESSAKLLPVGTLLVCTRATIGELAISGCELATNQGFKNLIPNNDYDVEFLFYLLTFHENELKRYACGSTFLELSKRDFEKRCFSVPPIAEQRAIAALLNTASSEVDTYRKGLERLTTEKRALMQQLLTGKQRVKI